MGNPHASTAGFTLIEVLASLAILSLLGSIVFMNLTPLVEQRRMESIESAVSNALEQARTVNIQRRGSVGIAEFIDERYPELKQYVTLSDGLKIIANGACNPGRIDIRYADRHHIFEVSELTCAMRRIS